MFFSSTGNDKLGKILYWERILTTYLFTESAKSLVGTYYDLSRPELVIF